MARMLFNKYRTQSIRSDMISQVKMYQPESNNVWLVGGVIVDTNDWFHFGTFEKESEALDMVSNITNLINNE